MSDLDLLLPNFGWVLPGVLAGSGLPGRGLAVKALPAFRLARAQGIGLVVSLLEVAPPASVLREAGLEGRHFAIPDHGAPADLEAFGAFVDEVAARIDAGAVVLAHCYAGIGRTGLFLAAYLARHRGLGAGEAVEAIRRLRPRSIETPSQLRALAALARRAEV